MSSASLLRLAAPDSERWRWCSPGSDGVRYGEGSVAEAGAALAGQRVTLLLPGPDVLLTRVKVPARGRAKAAAAIPWALEERLVHEVEALHFALGTADAEGNWPVAVIARDRLDGYLAAVHSAGLEPHSIVAEPLALPQPADGCWTVLEEAGRVTVRTGAHDGFGAEAELLEPLAATLAPPESIERLRAPDAPAVDWPHRLRTALDAAGAPRVLDDALAAFDPAQAGIELRQGPYSRSERIGRVLRQWRAPAALAVTLVVLSAASTAIEYTQLGAREQALRARMEQLFRDTFPEVQRVVNPRSQMKTRLESLREGGDGADFVDLLSRAGEPVANAEGITLAGLEWRNERLQLELQATDLQVLDRLRERLSDNGLAAELERAERQGEQVAGAIRLQEASE